MSEGKAARRERNRSAWRDDPLNANNVHQATREIAAPLSPEPQPDPADDEMTSASLRRLRSLMNDMKKPLHQRLSAAEIVIVYELGPGAAVGSDPADIAAASFRFMRAVADDPATPSALAMRALRCIASIENARAASRSTAAELFAKKEMLVGAANGERKRVMLARKGAWPPSSPDWALNVSDTIAWPAGWPGLWQWPPDTIAHNYKGTDPTSFRSMLRQVRATNRPDTFWDEYGPDAA
jgi:hypothetical protein